MTLKLTPEEKLQRKQQQDREKALRYYYKNKDNILEKHKEQRINSGTITREEQRENAREQSIKLGKERILKFVNKFSPDYLDIFKVLCEKIK